MVITIVPSIRDVSTSAYSLAFGNVFTALGTRVVTCFAELKFCAGRKLPVFKYIREEDISFPGRFSDFGDGSVGLQRS